MYLKFFVHLAYKENWYEFRKHPKIKWLDVGLEPPTSGLPVHCAIDRANLTIFWMLLIAYMNIACFIVML